MEASRTQQLLSEPPEMGLALLTINDVPALWTQIRPLLEEACEHSNGAFTPELVLAGMGLHDGVESLRMLAMIRGEREVIAVMVVAIVRAPTGKQTLECLLTAGEDVRSWMPFEHKMDDWARSLGCSSVRITRGRKGWLKALSHWKIGGYVLEREI